jgi:hypothetical protein
MPCRALISPVHLILSGSLVGESGGEVKAGDPWALLTLITLPTPPGWVSDSIPGDRNRLGSIDGTTNGSLLLLLLLLLLELAGERNEGTCVLIGKVVAWA